MEDRPRRPRGQGQCLPVEPACLRARDVNGGERVLKTEKERIVAELTDRLAATDTLIVADYRGLTNKELEALRARLTEHGARLSIVKNTLTRRAAEAAGADTLLALLEGPTAIAFVEANGDPAGVAKALADTARDTKVLAIRGGVLEGAPLSRRPGGRAREAPAGGHPPRPVPGGRRRTADTAGGAARGAAPRPRRPDRCTDRAVGRSGT